MQCQLSWGLGVKDLLHKLGSTAFPFSFRHIKDRGMFATQKGHRHLGGSLSTNADTHPPHGGPRNANWAVGQLRVTQRKATFAENILTHRADSVKGFQGV